MKPLTFMLIAGEASGDLLAAELVESLRAECPRRKSPPTRDVQPLRTGLAPRFFGAGGPHMAAAGVELAVDMTEHSLIGIWGAAKQYFKFLGIFNQLKRLALQRQPDAIVCVDFSGFNRPFAAAIRNRLNERRSQFRNWNPRLIQFVSPQVWASRPGRAQKMVGVFDLLLSTLPFEKEWYAPRTPSLRVEFVGNPLVDRHAASSRAIQVADARGSRILLLPGSRRGELKKHLPVLARATGLIRKSIPEARFTMVLPGETMRRMVADSGLFGATNAVEIKTGSVMESLSHADLAITKSGTITLECALFAVPAIVFYRTSAVEYALARLVATVKHISMPNILAGHEVFPEYVQDAATPENLADAATALLLDPERRRQIQSSLREIVSKLGQPGASDRASRLILNLFD